MALACPGTKLIDTRRQPGRLEELHQVVGAEHRARRRLPHSDAAHERGRRRQIASDRREVERRDRIDEPLESAVLELIPHARAVDGLLAVDLVRVADVEAPEVDQLADRIDLGLVHGLGLVEHRRGVDRVTPRRRQQFGCAQQNRRAILQRPVRPVTPRLERGVDRLLDVLWLGQVIVGQHVAVLEGHDRLTGLAGSDFLATDDERDIHALLRHRIETSLERRTVGCTWRVGTDRLVHRNGHTTVGVYGSDISHDELLNLESGIWKLAASGIYLAARGSAKVIT